MAPVAERLDHALEGNVFLLLRQLLQPVVNVAYALPVVRHLLPEPARAHRGSPSAAAEQREDHSRFDGGLNNRRRTMPAKSGAQQKAAGAALSAKRGDTPKSKLKGPSKQMAESMSESKLEEMASTKRKGKPEHASKK